jgi:hypothetical protein
LLVAYDRRKEYERIVVHQARSFAWAPLARRATPKAILRGRGT